MKYGMPIALLFGLAIAYPTASVAQHVDVSPGGVTVGVSRDHDRDRGNHHHHQPADRHSGDHHHDRPNVHVERGHDHHHVDRDQHHHHGANRRD